MKEQEFKDYLKEFLYESFITNEHEVIKSILRESNFEYFYYGYSEDYFNFHDLFNIISNSVKEDLQFDFTFDYLCLILYQAEITFESEMKAVKALEILGVIAKQEDRFIDRGRGYESNFIVDSVLCTVSFYIGHITEFLPDYWEFGEDDFITKHKDYGKYM